MITHQSALQRSVYIAALLLIALLGIIAIILWTEKSGRPLAVEKNALRTVAIQRPGYADIVLEYTQSQWQLTSPCQAIANPQRVQAFEQLQSPATHSYDAREVDLAEAGLLDPLAVITINGTNLKVGETDLSGERRYIQRGADVEFAPEWILSLVQGGTSAFANLNVFPDALTAVNAGSIDTSTSQLQQWQALTANQVIAWPLKVNVPELVQRYSINFISPTESGQMIVHEYEAFSAITKSDEHCAYIVSNAALPST
ncbi:MAG: hypothetical protein AB8B84_00850 [Granulosicoccus sp.]